MIILRTSKYKDTKFLDGLHEKSQRVPRSFYAFWERRFVFIREIGFIKLLNTLQGRVDRGFSFHANAIHECNRNAASNRLPFLRLHGSPWIDGEGRVSGSGRFQIVGASAQAPDPDPIGQIWRERHTLGLAWL
jgi:hypothetical protein